MTELADSDEPAKTYSKNQKDDSAEEIDWFFSTLLGPKARSDRDIKVKVWGAKKPRAGDH